MKSDVFNSEISCINDSRLRDNLVILLNMLPDYFYEVPASSTGKYHPSFSLGDGGLVRHSKVAFKIGQVLLNNESVQNFNSKEKDLLLISILVHDGLKCGYTKEEYTRFDHPILISNFIKENKNKFSFSDDEIEFICSCVETHMGQWTTDYNGNEVLKRPISKYQRFVHMCDYLSSQKFLDVKFNQNEIVN